METKENISLIEPALELKSEFLAMAEEFQDAGENEIIGLGSISIDDFDNSVSRAKDHSCGLNIAEGRVPATTYWLVRQGQILGPSNLRHELNDYLRKFGGHIGYSIRPSQRGKGFGILILKLTLEKARQLGLDKVLVTCDDDNFASARVIEKNGGILEGNIVDDSHKVPVRRYWIELTEKGSKK
jgi:predicted acetyltransferase